jgi:large subunit ribosomal protein L3
VSVFEGVMFVDVVGASKGKGFQGVMKRHNFAGMEASHGVERKHRSRGSIAGRATNRGWGPKPKKGMKMAGQMGNVRHTSRNMDVVAIDVDKNLLMVKGAVPGPNQGFVMIKESRRMSRSKQNALKAGKKG